MKAHDSTEDRTSNPRIAKGAETLGELVDRRLTRRGLLGGIGAVSGLALAGCTMESKAGDVASAAAATPSAFGFEEIKRAVTPMHEVPPGYVADMVLRWGDPLFEDSPVFEPARQTAAAQRRQFGYNNDYLGFVPLEPAADGAARGLLCVNHEFTSTELMFPGIAAGYPESMTAELCLIEMAAHGGTIVEIQKGEKGWAPVVGSPFNRRITVDTPMRVTGPAAGNDRMKTSADESGTLVFGTINNCAGGITPWGTYLMAEENFNGYFHDALPEGYREAENYARYGVPGGSYQWGRFFDRFNLAKEPNEPNRFGWVVEVDPSNPRDMPKKRTALGRFKHEGAESVVAPDGRVVIYMGDDQRFDYLYKFVTAGRFDAANPAVNRDLLDDGTLYVARFDEAGGVDWLALTHGDGPLTEENGFASQGDVMIETRRAADLLGATPMDRPEDVEPDPASGKVYVMLTNNTHRRADQVDAANPRAGNAFGHIIEVIEPDGDFTATRSRWEFLVKCGDPSEAEFGAVWNPLTSPNGWFGSPDNCAVDPSGRLWIATDGNERTGANDGVWALETEGERRGTGRAFFRAPVGAEVCGPKFTPAGDTFFVAVQHPGDGHRATYENPTTRWPDFEDGVPPRPAVLAIRREDGGPVGS